MENFGSLIKEPVLHSVADREPLKCFEKRSALLGFSVSKGLSKGILRKMADLDSSWRSPATHDHEHHVPLPPSAGPGASARLSCYTWTCPCDGAHPHVGLPVLLPCPSLEQQALTYTSCSIAVSSTEPGTLLVLTNCTHFFFFFFFFTNVRWNDCSSTRETKSGSG